MEPILARPTSVVLGSEAGMLADRPHETFVDRYREAFVEELRAFLRCVQEDSPVAVGATDALAAINAAHAARTSVLENRPVRVESAAEAHS